MRRLLALLLLPTIAHADDSPAINDLVAPGANVRKLADGFRFTEGPTADGKGGVYFTDIALKRVHHWSPEKGLTTYWQGEDRSVSGLFLRDGRLLATSKPAFGILDLTNPREPKRIAHLYQGRPINGPNDLWIAPDGSVYFTDQEPRNPKQGTQDGGYVHRLGPSGRTLERVSEDLWRPNGIVGSEDGKLLYVAVPKQRRTFVYDIGEDGGLSNRRVAAESPSDGLALDEHGNLYVTWQAVKVYAPGGRHLGDIAFPEAPANVTFGGPDGRTLFVTARKGLYSLKMSVRGQRPRMGE